MMTHNVKKMTKIKKWDQKILANKCYIGKLLPLVAEIENVLLFEIVGRLV